MTIQQVMSGGGFLNVNVIVTSGAGSITSPISARTVTVEAIGGGGAGFGNTTTTSRASGGGGQYAISNLNISIATPGTTIVYYSVGAAGADSWVNVGTNSAPASATVGCLAKAGGAATTGVAGSGAVAGSIGSTTRLGGNGATGNNSAGGGGSGATTAGSASTAGTDTTGRSTSIMGGGTGGAYNTGTGTAPGGGGGGSGTTGTNLAGGIGRVRITFYG